MRFFISKKLNTYSPGQIIWQRFYRNATGLPALAFIILSSLIALAGYLITPDKSPYANRQLLEIATQKPGFSVQLLKQRNNEKQEKAGMLHKMLFGSRQAFSYYPIESYRFMGDSILIQLFDPEPQAFPLQLAFHVADVCYPLQRVSVSNNAQLQIQLLSGETIETGIEQVRNLLIKNHITKQTYWLGTDQFGRDMLSRLLIGTRVSLAVGFISVFISLLIGISLGSIGGYYRGRIDDFIMWLINVVWSIPTLLMVIAITFALGKGFWQVFVAVGLTMWVEVARVVRGQMISLREKEFVEAGKALGYSDFRIITKHILPNIISPVIVISAANFASAILIEAGLSFLGLGVQPPMPSWGSMIKENYAFIILDSPYLALLPGVAIMLMVLAFMLVGNALRDAQDVKLS
jgi:ABC-type dipeptide/oligopeptide/nickel transport system permease subunit